jgi:signal transduction histidine kinase
MNPSPLTIIWSMLSATSLTLGLMHVALWWRRRDRALLFSAVMAIASGILALSEMAMMQATEVGPFVKMLKLSHLPVATVLVAMVWFVHLRLGTGRRWLAWTITGLWACCLVANFMSPFSLVYRQVELLKRLPTFWGEEFSMAIGPANPLKFVADATSVLIMGYVIDAALQAWRAGRRFGAAVIGGSITFFIVVAGIYTPFVDAGIARTPSIITLAFFFIVLALSWEITRDAARSREVTLELEQARREMDRLMRANLLGELASTIAHELNQPLTAVLANAQVARHYLQADPPRTDDAAAMLDLIIRDDKRAAEVIRRLHDLVARGKVEREALDFNLVVGETMDLCAREIRGRGVEVRLDLEPGLGAVPAGKVEMQQVVLNLVHNALQALEGRAERDLHLETRSGSKGIRFTVADSGPGFAHSELEDIFNPFKGDREGGIGMGLSICRRIIEAHGGGIRAERPAEGGARFVVDLPYESKGEMVAND